MSETLKRVTLHTVNIRRPSGEVDDKGKPILRRIQIPPGKLFSFTRDEHDQILAMGTDALRAPRNESRTLSRGQAYRLASDDAASRRAAPDDAGNIAATAAAGKAKMSDTEQKAVAHLKKVAAPAEPEEDEDDSDL